MKMKHPKNGCVEGECEWCAIALTLIDTHKEHIETLEGHIDTLNTMMNLERSIVKIERGSKAFIREVDSIEALSEEGEG